MSCADPQSRNLDYRFLKGWLVSFSKKCIETLPLLALFPCVLFWEELGLNGICRSFCAIVFVWTRA
jgi:hypothetical protein